MSGNPGPSHKRKNSDPTYPILAKLARTVGPSGFPAITHIPFVHPQTPRLQRSPNYAVINKNFRMSAKYSAKKSMNDGTSYRFQPKGPEKKVLDVALSNDSHPIDGSQTNLSNFRVLTSGPTIPQGTDMTERIGKKITLKKIHARFQFRTSLTDNGGTTTGDAWMRLICVIDYQTNGATIVPTDLIRFGNQGAFDVYGYRNMFASTRFRTLVDDFFPMTESFSADAPYAIREYNFKLNLPIMYGGVTGAEAERTENSIRWILIGYSPAGTNGGDILRILTDCIVRYRYSDN